MYFFYHVKNHYKLEAHFPLVSSFLCFIAFLGGFASSYIKSVQEECKQGLCCDLG